MSRLKIDGILNLKIVYDKLQGQMGTLPIPLLIPCTIKL